MNSELQWFGYWWRLRSPNYQFLSWKLNGVWRSHSQIGFGHSGAETSDRPQTYATVPLWIEESYPVRCIIRVRRCTERQPSNQAKIWKLPFGVASGYDAGSRDGNRQARWAGEVTIRGQVRPKPIITHPYSLLMGDCVNQYQNSTNQKATITVKVELRNSLPNKTESFKALSNNSANHTRLLSRAGT